MPLATDRVGLACNASDTTCNNGCREVANAAVNRYDDLAGRQGGICAGGVVGPRCGPIVTLDRAGHPV